MTHLPEWVDRLNLSGVYVWWCPQCNAQLPENPVSNKPDHYCAEVREWVSVEAILAAKREEWEKTHPHDLMLSLEIALVKTQAKKVEAKLTAAEKVIADLRYVRVALGNILWNTSQHSVDGEDVLRSVRSVGEHIGLTAANDWRAAPDESLRPLHGSVTSLDL